ncbi:ABC transporter ATP-binding protein [Hazenella coriacea]|uniref:ABC-2 type transport system ATP-binding protein n=1 Tax=Hazenella coriacea TaxID=1179467 RepID=A0A4R3L9M2_9BACL|nr:ABC transporter ATP-binding protein [Hazenella coriacea]TCS96781.1 ABC-2 type transport system ATP-binding protein [Hazenella coriacea]
MIVCREVCHSLADSTFQLRIQQLQFQQGLTLVVGKNGAGKSTLLRLLATVEPPNEGEMIYQEGVLAQHLPEIRSQIGYLPSELEAPFEMTGLQFLKYMALLKGIFDDREIQHWVDKLGLEKIQHQKIGRLSTGNQQMLGICQAFLGSPHYLMLDEPLTHLDLWQQKKVVDALTTYADKHLVVVVTHQLQEWEKIDQILQLNQGQVAFYGSSSEWTNDLPVYVWEGMISNKIPSLQLPTKQIIAYKKESDGLRMMIFASEKPVEGFTFIPTTIEYAYLIRAYLLGENPSG